MNQVQFGQLLLKEDEYRNKEWKTVSLLDIVNLGNLAWKRQRNFFKKLYHLFEQYEYETDTAALKDFLEKRDGHQLTFEVIRDKKTLSQQVLEKSLAIGGSVSGVPGKLQLSDKSTSKVPSIVLTFEWIKISQLEEDLKSRKLNIASNHIREKKSDNLIPCIISHIVTADVSEDEPDKMATSVRTQTVSVGSSVDPPIASESSLETPSNFSLENRNERKSSIQGPVLYKVLPLEVETKGEITAKRDSVGFKNTSDSNKSRALFSGGSTEPTLESSFKEIEEWIQPVIDDKTVVAAFNAISEEDIHYLNSKFREMEGLPEDFVLDDCMSKPCRDILLFAKFQESSGKLILKEKFKTNGAVTACHYLVALLAEVHTATTGLLKKSTVNLFPLLKMILLDDSLKEVTVDDIWKCQDARGLLEILHIQVKGSIVDVSSASEEMVAKVVWLAMLYDATACVEQQ